MACTGQSPIMIPKFPIDIIKHANGQIMTPLMIPRRRRPMKKGRKRIKLHNEAKIPEGGSILSDLSNKKNTSNSPTRFHRKHYKKNGLKPKKKK